MDLFPFVVIVFLSADPEERATALYLRLYGGFSSGELARPDLLRH